MEKGYPSILVGVTLPYRLEIHVLERKVKEPKMYNPESYRTKPIVFYSEEALRLSEPSNSPIPPLIGQNVRYSGSTSVRALGDL